LSSNLIASFTSCTCLPDTTSALALNTTLTDKSQFTKLTDGTDTALITGSGELNVLATAQPGVDIGDVTINNASGGSAVNIQDGGNSITVDNGGTFAVQETQVLTDNTAFTDGTTKVFPVGYIYDEIAGTALTENDIATPRITVNRSQIGILEDGTTRGRYAVVTASNALKWMALV